MKIGFIGAGNVARALGKLLVAGGHSVSFGGREGEARAAREVGSFADAARADLVVLAVPFSAARDLLPSLAAGLEGKIVVDATNPVNPDWSPMLLGQESSAGEEVARALPGARVVKAFNTVFADVMHEDRLVRDGARVTCFVASDDVEARGSVAELARTAGFAPLEVGPLAMSRHLEAMAHLNIQMAVGMKGGTNAAFVYHRVG
jgi:8-hydroxy-5-deazaflavin:NADPH oxidoreductase